jgi:hypothetical protein
MNYLTECWKLTNTAGEIIYMSQIMTIYSLGCYIHILHTSKFLKRGLSTRKISPSCFALEENTIWQV